MSRLRIAMAVLVALVSIGVVHADVKTQEKSQIKFEGMLGRMFGLFGGKAAREGLVSTVAVQGDRKMSVNEYTGEIVDLAEQKVYELDMRKKSYTVKTFADIRREMEEAQREARKSAGQKEEGEPQKEYEVDFDVKQTGQRKAINSFDCREVIITITVREKGKTLDQSGGIVMTATSWLGPKVAAMNEIAAFDLRYAKALQGPGGLSAQEQMAAAMAMYPGLQQAMARMQAEKVNMDGTAIQTTVAVEGVKGKEQMSQASEDEKPSGVGGVLGGLGRRIGRKKEGEDAGAKNRSTIMTMTSEVLSISSSVAPPDVSIPAGFKQK